MRAKCGALGVLALGTHQLWFSRAKDELWVTRWRLTVTVARCEEFPSVFVRRWENGPARARDLDESGSSLVVGMVGMCDCEGLVGGR